MRIEFQQKADMSSLTLWENKKKKINLVSHLHKYVDPAIKILNMFVSFYDLILDATYYLITKGNTSGKEISVLLSTIQLAVLEVLWKHISMEQASKDLHIIKTIMLSFAYESNYYAND